MNIISLQCVTDAPSAKELTTILLFENYSVYHSVGILQGCAFAGRIALELKIILRITLIVHSLLEAQIGAFVRILTFDYNSD